mmetsp:Transcript_18670/g.70937  ORF Transcript_18670/g.70937 Transcript_18670/m.70937 type:complete len:401 (-) Transcript_18670:1715-2917(-)
MRWERRDARQQHGGAREASRRRVGDESPDVLRDGRAHPREALPNLLEESDACSSSLPVGLRGHRNGGPLGEHRARAKACELPQGGGLLVLHDVAQATNSGSPGRQVGPGDDAVRNGERPQDRVGGHAGPNRDPHSHERRALVAPRPRHGHPLQGEGQEARENDGRRGERLRVRRHRRGDRLQRAKVRGPQVRNVPQVPLVHALHRLARQHHGPRLGVVAHGPHGAEGDPARGQCLAEDAEAGVGQLQPRRGGGQVPHARPAEFALCDEPVGPAAPADEGNGLGNASCDAEQAHREHRPRHRGAEAVSAAPEQLGHQACRPHGHHRVAHQGCDGGHQGELAAEHLQRDCEVVGLLDGGEHAENVVEPGGHRVVDGLRQQQRAVGTNRNSLAGVAGDLHGDG